MMTNAYVFILGASGLRPRPDTDLQDRHHRSRSTPGAPIVRKTAAERADLKPGASVMFEHRRMPRASRTNHATISENGVAPPMWSWSG